MKIALYVEDSLEQIVLTPESDTEKAILGKLHDGTRSMEMKKGSFYQCQGGWVRHGIYATSTASYGRDQNDESTMIVLRRTEVMSK